MSVEIACPTCSAKIRAPETVIGKQVRCPKCKNAFTAAAAASAPAADDPFSFSEPPVPGRPSAAATAAAPALPDFGPPPFEGAAEAPDNEPRPVRYPARADGNAFVELLTFHRFITPTLVVVLYYVGSVVAVLAGLVSAGVSAVTAANTGNALVGVVGVLAAGAGTFLSLLVARVWCETTILFFRIGEDLRELRERAGPAREL